MLIKSFKIKGNAKIIFDAREYYPRQKEDGLILESSKNLTGAELNSENDHRLFMAFCIAGTYIGNCVVTDSESVQVSYPNFIHEMNRLGAKIQVL